MNREIKFRGKRIDTREWIYGYLFSQQVIIVKGKFIEIIPETLGQYTGLKDKNNEEIYEDDILTTDILKKYNIYHIIEWNKEQARFSEYSQKNEFYIIGNIYDNPELIKID